MAQSLNKDLTSTTFKEVIENISLLFNEHDLTTKPYINPNLIDFNSLEAGQKKQALSDASSYLETLIFAKQQGWSAKDDLHFLWSSFKKMGLKPTSDFFNFASNEDAIEIYNLQGIQVWRNLKFMEVCNYTLEQVFSFSWTERYVRNDKATQKILAFLDILFAQKPAKTMESNIANVLTEKFSEDNLVIDVLHKYMCPVTDSNGQLAGFAVGSGAKIIGKTLPKTNESIKPSLSLV